jgi:hypothetical protein
MNYEDKIFNAAVMLYAHKDITLTRAVSDAAKIWEQSVEAAIVYEKTEDCTCAACCQKERYVSDVADNGEKLDCIERRYGKYSSGVADNGEDFLLALLWKNVFNVDII